MPADAEVVEAFHLPRRGWMAFEETAPTAELAVMVGDEAGDETDGAGQGVLQAMAVSLSLPMHRLLDDTDSSWCPFL